MGTAGLPHALTRTARFFRKGAAWRCRLLAWLALARQRRSLLTLDEHLLRDIGVPRHVAAEEAAQPFWDVPESWKR
jgi:uncharacterized protein YjiS (DUF1127 family)